MQGGKVLSEFNIWSALFRLFLAVVLAGSLGFERESKDKPAGFRTYMTICLGATLTVLISEYESEMLQIRWAAQAAEAGLKLDVSRLCAQVVNGIGFLGAGTIIVTGSHEVKGLITSSGLWASACMGLAVGAGCYPVVAAGFLLILLTLQPLEKLSTYIRKNARYMNLYLEFSRAEDLLQTADLIRRRKIEIKEIEMDRGKGKNLIKVPNAVLYLRLPKGMDHIDLISEIAESDRVQYVEELLH